ncbi:MAG TPA: hypothetical protein VK982_12295, partial [Bacteroidales bacterium]|nr:hypothetical protein [Bacteroidales bacterium]
WAKHYTTDNQNSETFIQGIKTLSEWLKESTNNNGLPFWIVGTISLLGLLTAIATLFVGWTGLFGLVLILILFIYAYSKKSKGSNSLSIREKDFINSGLSAPSRWDTENVANRLDKLIENLRDIKDADRVSQRLMLCRDSLNNLHERIDNLNKIREEWVSKLQTAPGFPKNNSNDFSSLYWFLINVRKWQDAHIQKDSSEAELSEVRKQYGEELSKINALFKEAKFDAVEDVSKGKAIFNELKKQENVRKEQTQLLEQKREQIEEQNRLEKRAEEKLLKIYQALEIHEKEKESVLELVKQLPDYKQKHKDHYAAEQAFSEKEDFLKNHSLYNQHQAEIDSLSVDQAQEQVNKYKETASQLEKIQEQITSIETRIQDKKRGHELEDVLTNKENALDSLDKLLEDNLSSATGDLIINQLKEETQNQNRPTVFKRANQIFNNITHGQYELKLDEEGEPKFKAYDTVRKLGQDLSELSTGTRVQLLLSVRLAYVETVESSIKLPLLADELLANSDDERAKAIIESLIEISRQGRQIFYFTAQADEVGKWLAYLQEQTELKYKIIQLDGNTNKSQDYSEFIPDLDKFNLLQAVPAPNGESHKEYGNLIHKRPFNVLIQNSSELHVWYLTEDVDLLYDCLKRDITSWGQLESYYRNNGRINNLNKKTFSRIQRKVELLQRFQELYRVGRSLPIDRDVLESSNAITDAFIDRVADKLDESNHDPKKLLKALRNGEVTRFRADNADELENYLMTEGYIDDREILKTEEIISNMHALISSFEMETQEAETFINRILEYAHVSRHDIS